MKDPMARHGFSLLNKDRGYSLVELLVGVAIFTIAMAAILTMALSSIRGNAFAQRMTEARFLAQGKLEELRNIQPVSSLVDGNDELAPYRRSWTITAGPTTTSRWIEVRVVWEDKGEHTVELRSMTRNAGT